MADYTRHVRTTRRVEFTLRSPTNWCEVDKAFNAIKKEIPPEMARYDDTVTVEAREDVVVISYLLEDE